MKAPQNRAVRTTGTTNSVALLLIPPPGKQDDLAYTEPSGHILESQAKERPADVTVSRVYVY